MFRTCVGRAAIWLSSSPRLLFTASPVGKPWKKLGTPEATYEGISDPKPPRILETSPARSLMTPLRDLSVFVASQAAGEAVIRGCSGTTAAAGWRAAGDAEMIGRRANSSGERVFNMIIVAVAVNSPSGGNAWSCAWGTMR